jgi:hypothetical protein
VTDQPIIEVILDTHGPTITIRAAVPLVEAVAAAERLYERAVRDYPPRLPEPQPGLVHGVGFAGELRDTPPVQPSSMHWAPGPYPIQPPGGPQ